MHVVGDATSGGRGTCTPGLTMIIYTHRMSTVDGPLWTGTPYPYHVPVDHAVGVVITPTLIPRAHTGHAYGGVPSMNTRARPPSHTRHDAVWNPGAPGYGRTTGRCSSSTAARTLAGTGLGRPPPAPPPRPPG